MSVCPKCEANAGVKRVVAGNLEIITDAPRCAFESGIFAETNWNCGTLNALRDLMLRPTWCEEQHLGVHPYGNGRFVVLGWYKQRGRVELAIVIDEHESGPLTLTEALLALETGR